jgi:hypothetical protein
LKLTNNHIQGYFYFSGGDGAGNYKNVAIGFIDGDILLALKNIIKKRKRSACVFFCLIFVAIVLVIINIFPVSGI